MICLTHKSNFKIKKDKIFLANLNKYKKKQNQIIYKTKAIKKLLQTAQLTLILKNQIKAFYQNK